MNRTKDQNNNNDNNNNKPTRERIPDIKRDRERERKNIKE